MIQGVATAIAVTLVAGLLALLAKVAGGGATVEKGAVVLRYGGLFRAVGLLGVVAAVVVLIVFAVGVWLGWDEPGALAGAGITIAVFLIPAVPLLVEGYRRRIVLTADGIVSRGWFGTTGPVPWAAVEKVKYQHGSQRYAITAGKVTIYVSAYLAGQTKFRDACEEWLKPEVFERAFGDS